MLLFCRFLSRFCSLIDILSQFCRNFAAALVFSIDCVKFALQTRLNSDVEDSHIVKIALRSRAG
jgi:hypothetical protein